MEAIEKRHPVESACLNAADPASGLAARHPPCGSNNGPWTDRPSLVPAAVGDTLVVLVAPKTGRSWTQSNPARAW